MKKLMMVLGALCLVPCAARAVELGVTVNGVDVGSGAGTGWAYDGSSHYVEIRDPGSYVLSGTNVTGAVMVAIAADAEVTLSNLCLKCTAFPQCCIRATNGANVTLLVAGENTLDAYNNDVRRGEGLRIENGSHLTVTNAPGFADADAVLIAKGSWDYAAIGVGRSGTADGRAFFEIAGGTVYANWENPADSSVGIGGNVAADIVISGGRVFAKGGYEAAGIGSAHGSTGGVPDIRITGGYVEAVGGSRVPQEIYSYGAAAIGGSGNAKYGSVTVSGGTVKATGGNDGSDMIAGECEYDRGGGAFVVTGGNVCLTRQGKKVDPDPAPVNGSERVWCVTVESEEFRVKSEEFVEITGLKDYGMKDVRAIDGKVYLWLPNGTHVFAVDGVHWYRAVVNNADTSAILVTAEVSQSNIAENRTLQSGNFYRFTENVEYKAPAGESALRVADGADVTLEILAGVKVTLRGGDANGRDGAGAGIEVPANAKLTIKGEGALISYGGKAANGGNGLKGERNAGYESGSTDIMYSGAGGDGGDGGGGAGAGIGGRGGNGGAGGAGGPSVKGSYDKKDNLKNTVVGNPGKNGSPGSKGGTCGAVNIEGTVCVVSYGGSCGASGGAGGEYSGYYIDSVNHSSHFFEGFSGGGGGGGSSGLAASDIGGGGGGGSGGGGGGSGGISWYYYHEKPFQDTGDGLAGAGGHGGLDGQQGKSACGVSYTYGKDTYKRDSKRYDLDCSAGGTAGTAGSRGGEGTLTVGKNVQVLAGRGRYSVGQIPETGEDVVYDNGKLFRVSNGVSTEIAFEVVTNDTSSFEDGKWYVAKDTVSRDVIRVHGRANLVLLHGASLTADSSGVDKPQYNIAGIEVLNGNSLSIFGVESGSLTAIGSMYSAGIGGTRKYIDLTWKVFDCGTVTINGGTVTATGGSSAAGIGGGCYGAGGDVTINGGSVAAYGARYVNAIGAGHKGSGGTLTLGPRVLKFDDNHWREVVATTFDIPEHLRYVSAQTDVGEVKVTEGGGGRRIVYLPKGHDLTLTFCTVNDFAVFQVPEMKVTFGSTFRDFVVDANLLPKAKMNDRLMVGYVLPGGTIAAENAWPLYSTGSSMEMGLGAWYVVKGEVTTAMIKVRGKANLILADDAKLTVNGGIRLESGNQLTVYGQRIGNGVLVANGVDGAGIGGNGSISGGDMTINGGTVTATGGWGGAGIGGSWHGAGGRVTINGGRVTAKGGKKGAGIGGGNVSAGGNVTITGGRVTAIGGDGAKGIGGGGDGGGGSVKITGGTVEADGLNGQGLGGTVTIDGGSVKTKSCESQPKNGAGKNVHCVTVGGLEGLEGLEGLDGYGMKDIVVLDGKVYLYLPDGAYSLTINGVLYRFVVEGKDLTAVPNKYLLKVPYVAKATATVWINNQVVTSAGFAGGYVPIAVDGAEVVVSYATVVPSGMTGETSFTASNVTGDLCLPAENDAPHVNPIDYVDAGGVACKISDYLFIGDGTKTLSTGWYVAIGQFVSSGIVVAEGCTANLILVDGAKVTVDGGICVGNGTGLNIYGQRGGTGTLIANGAKYRAGIGGWNLKSFWSEDGDCGTVTINGGMVTATGGKDGAGIGGGRNGAGGIVTINGGIVTATGGSDGAGIGGGWFGEGGTVTITGGRVTANGRVDGAGIGGGWGGEGGTVTITGGRVTANGRGVGAGIGGGGDGGGGSVKITGGTVIADVADGGYGQGLGESVTIDGGSVKAKSCETQPKNGAGKDVHCVIVEGMRDEGRGMGISGLDGYGTKDVYPIDGRVHLWLPDGTHSFALSDGSTTLHYYAVVKGRVVTVEPLPPSGEVGFFVNGRDVGGDHDLTAGWSYINEVLTLNQKRDYVLSGAALENQVQIKVATEDARIILSNAVVITSGRAALEVGKDASLLMAGDTSYLMTTNGTSAVTVAEGATLTVDLGDGGDRLESMICVFGSEKNAIGGGGAVQVNGGTLFALSSAPAFASGTGIECGEDVVMKTGADPETARFADKAGEVPCVLVAPVVTVTVAKDIPHVSDITVSNAVEQITGEKIEDAMVYRVMLEDDVFVGYEVDAGFVSQVPNPLVYFAVEDENITIDAEVLKMIALVTPGKPTGPFATPEAAEEAVKTAAFTPSPEVAAMFGTDEVLATYCNMFTFKVVETEGGQWAVEAVLTPEAWTNVAQSAQEATRQIPIGDIAALGSGEPTNVTVGGCVPGFYYTLYGGSDLGWVTPRSEGAAGTVDVYGPVLCEPDKPVTFEAVEKPSDAAGFFSIGVTVSDVDVWLRENPDGQDDEELYGPHIE